MSGTPRTSRSVERSRGRFRVLVFGSIMLVAAVAGAGAAGAVAAVAVLAGVASVSVARNHGHALAHSFVVADWLFLGVCLALSGGAHSWLLLAVPALAIAELAPSPRVEWPYLVAPALVTAIVLAIADPTLGGDKLLALGAFALSVGLGVAIAARVSGSRPARTARVSVDDTTGLPTSSRALPCLREVFDTAAATHTPLAVVCVRLDHFGDTRDFYGEQRSEAIVRAVARRLKHRLGDDDLAFRVRSDTLLVALPGVTLRDARAWAADTRHGIGAHLVERHKQTVSVGVSAYPPVRSADDLVREALDALGGAVPAVASVAEAQASAAPRSVRRRPQPATTAPEPALTAPLPLAASQ